MKLDTIKKKLLGHKVYLEELISKGTKSENSNIEQGDIGDQANAVILEELNRSMQHTGMDEYNMILKALERIDNGDYGICIECDTAISEKRLLMFPNATRCLVCQEAAEEGKL